MKVWDFLTGTVKAAKAVLPDKEAEDARYHLALDYLYPILGMTPNYLNVWLTHNYSPADWQPTFEKWQAKIDKLRSWAETLPRLDKAAYVGWLDYYQHELDSARDELRTKKEKKQMEDYDRRNRSKEQVKAAFREIPGFPKPPNGS